MPGHDEFEGPYPLSEPTPPPVAGVIVLLCTILAPIEVALALLGLHLTGFIG